MRRLRQIGALRRRLLTSAVRTTLFAAVLSVVLAGEPPAPVRAVMVAQPTPSWRRVRFPLIMTLTPTRTATPVSTATPVPTATPERPRASGPPTWIEAPAIQLSAPVVETGWRSTNLGGVEATEWLVPDNAAGFHKGTAYPGHPGNTVISGHHNIGGEVFRYLIDLEIGDELILYVDKTPYHYTVTQKELVREMGVSDEVRRENARWIAATDDERLTLVTCWPYTGNSHRLIIVAMPKAP